MNKEVQLLKDKVKNLRILYAEDENELREGTELFLNKFFNFVESASDGEEGLKKFNQNNYNVIFTDIMMPNMDGKELLKNIKEINPNTFAVTLTASDVKESDMTDFSDLYFRKPISYENMIVIMREIVKKFDL